MASGWPNINTLIISATTFETKRSSSSAILFSRRTILRTTVGAAIVARQSQNASDNGLLQLEEVLIDFGTVAAIVVEVLHQGSFFAVDHHRNPGRHFVFLLRLKVVSSIVCQMSKEYKIK